METVFIKILNMSIAAGWMILAVILLRSLLKRAPKALRCFLWLLVGIRLVIPFSWESVWSLIPSSDVVGNDILYSETPAIHSGIDLLDQAVNPVLSGSLAPDTFQSVNPMQVAAGLASMVWVFGTAVLLLYSAVSYLRLRRRLFDAVRLRDNIWQSEKAASPFVLGLFRPRIYLPYHLSEPAISHVIAHEQAHIQRHDHWIKPIAFLILTVYWFHPLVWLAYILLCRDIELACDERVIKDMDLENKKEYSEALLSCSVPRHTIAACPLAFGEAGVRLRIKNVLNHKKPAFWLILAALLSCVVLSVCFLTNPPGPEPDFGENASASATAYEFQTPSGMDTVHEAPGNTGQKAEPEAPEDNALLTLDESISAAILEHNKGSHQGGNFACESHVTLAEQSGERYSEEAGAAVETLQVYAMVLYMEFQYDGNSISDTGGSHIPCVLSFDLDEHGNYHLTNYWEPRDGSYYGPDIKKRFGQLPPETAAAAIAGAMDTQKYILPQIQQCYAQSSDYWQMDTDAFIGQLFGTILSSPSADASPAAYIDEHPLEVRELTYYGDDTLRYIFSEFLAGGQTSLKGHVMRYVMDGLIGNEALDLEAATGQEYFDAWKSSVQLRHEEEGMEALKEKAPKACLLLQMLGELSGELSSETFSY